MKTKKASIITKLIVLAFGVYLSITLLGLHGQIESAEARRETLENQITQLAGENEIFYREIENSTDPATMERIARNRYHLVMPGERVFYGLTD